MDKEEEEEGEEKETTSLGIFFVHPHVVVIPGAKVGEKANTAQ